MPYVGGMARNNALTVPCPVCYAPAGRWCGRQRWNPWVARRWRLARPHKRRYDRSREKGLSRGAA